MNEQEVRDLLSKLELSVELETSTYGCGGGLKIALLLDGKEVTSSDIDSYDLKQVLED